MLYQLFHTYYIDVFKCLTALVILSYDPYGGVVKFPIGLFKNVTNNFIDKFIYIYIYIYIYIVSLWTGFGIK